jgi:hypothetical protein
VRIPQRQFLHVAAALAVVASASREGGAQASPARRAGRCASCWAIGDWGVELLAADGCAGKVNTFAVTCAAKVRGGASDSERRGSRPARFFVGHRGSVCGYEKPRPAAKRLMVNPQGAGPIFAISAPTSRRLRTGELDKWRPTIEAAHIKAE